MRDEVLGQRVDLKRSRYEVIEGIAPFDEDRPRRRPAALQGRPAGAGRGDAGALAAFQREREGDVAKIEKTGRRNEQMMMPSNALFYWVRNEALGHTPDEKLLDIAEGMTSDEA